MSTPKLNLDELAEGQASGEITHNGALNVLDAMAHVNILDRDLTTPPGGESDGDTYLVKAAGTGAWVGHDNEIAIWIAGTGYVFVVLYEGLIAWIADENILRLWNGAAWVAPDPGAVQADGSVPFTGDQEWTDGTKGIILRDTSGTPHRWRMTIDAAGALVTTDLGAV